MTGQADIVAGAPSVVASAGPGNSQPEMLGEVPRASFHPNSTSVEAGFFTWEIATGEVICDPVTYQMHGLPLDQPATMEQFLSRVPPSDLAQVLRAIEQKAGTSPP